MFKELRYQGDFKQIITSEAILALCPWLWAFRQIWAEGWACESGSVHNTNQGNVFEQDVSVSENVYFHMVKDHIHSVHKLPPRQVFKRGASLEMENNPQCRGTNLAERIVHETHWPVDTLRTLVAEGRIFISTVVVETNGPVDRSEHFYIYREIVNPSTGALRNLLEIILPLVNEENLRTQPS